MVTVTQVVLVKASPASVISCVPSHAMGNFCDDWDAGKISGSVITLS